MYKKFLDTNNGSTVEGISLTRTNKCLHSHQNPTYPIIITNIMTIKIRYHIFLYIINTNSSSVGQNIDWCQGITTYCIYTECPKIFSTE